MPYQIYTTMDKPENPYQSHLEPGRTWVERLKHRCWQEGADAQFALSEKRISQIAVELEEIVDSNYRDRVQLWEALKDYIERIRREGCPSRYQ